MSRKRNTVTFKLFYSISVAVAAKPICHLQLKYNTTQLRILFIQFTFYTAHCLGL